MPEPISSSNSSTNACFPTDDDPQMSLDPSVSGGMSLAPPAAPKPTPGGPVFPPATPLKPIAVMSGSATLVAGHTTITAKGALGALTPSSAGNVGVRAAVAEGSITITNAATKMSTTAQGALGTSELDIGSKNVDGSEGAHIKVGAALYSAEVTSGTPDFQLTVGADLGVGLEASSGERDLDRDGKTEYCFRAGTSVVVGMCFEPASAIEVARTGVEALKKLVAP
jgi:hypothetical protein